MVNIASTSNLFGPAGITLGPDGNIWYTDNLLNTIGRLTLRSAAITEFPTPMSGSGPWSIGVGPTVQPVPAPPTAVTGSNPFGSPVISWTASTSSNVTGYNVYRSTGQNGPFVLLGTTTSTTFTDSNPPAVNCGTNTLYYVVTTVETGNTESANSTR